MLRSLSTYLLSVLGLLVLVSCGDDQAKQESAGTAPAAAAPAVVRHDMHIAFYVEENAVTIDDRVTIPADADTVHLDAGCGIWAQLYDAAAEADPARMEEVLAAQQSHTIASEAVALTAAGKAPHDLKRVKYTFTAHQPTSEVRFSRENVGGEIAATIGDEGIWLSSGVAWLPNVDGALHAGRFEITTPTGWFPVMSGSLVSRTEAHGEVTTVYEITAPVDGISLVARAYDVVEREHAGVTMRTCLLAEDGELSDLYLERTAHYLDLYTELIGPYPYDAFTTVENWFPTGYGMPGWTLLGAQVIRLPFIPYTSFGHEIAHNWWGNSVFVDRSEGNWCEGLTVYCADYEYKRLESEAAAREYRRNQLKDYAAYIGGHPERDFPLATFMERHSGATRAVGYGKSMAVWRMLEVELGRETVVRSLQRVYREFRGRPAAWSDFFAVLAAESDRDLEGFRRQWLERAGAPTLSLAAAEKDGDDVTFTLNQTDEPYDLLVPVRLDTPSGPVRETVRLTDASQSFRLQAPRATGISVDPDFDLFRHLHDAEIEPTISRVLAAERRVFVSVVDDLEFEAYAQEFAKAFCECDDPEFAPGGEVQPGVVNVVINPGPDLVEQYRPAELTYDGHIMTVGGQDFRRVDVDFVYAARGPHGTTDLVIQMGDPEQLPRLGQRLGHYGKYSWLAFPREGGRAIRGNWSPAGGPLHVAFAP